MAETDVFEHSTPVLYDRYMGPLLFEPYARYVAKQVAALRPDCILGEALTDGAAWNVSARPPFRVRPGPRD